MTDANRPHPRSPRDGHNLPEGDAFFAEDRQPAGDSAPEAQGYDAPQAGLPIEDPAATTDYDREYSADAGTGYDSEYTAERAYDAPVYYGAGHDAAGYEDAGYEDAGYDYDSADYAEDDFYYVPTGDDDAARADAHAHAQEQDHDNAPIAGAGAVAGAAAAAAGAAGLAGAATPRAGAHAAPAHAAEHEDPEGQRERAVPVRGLAMILLALGLALIIWAGFNLFGGKDSGDTTAGGDSATSQGADAGTAADPNANGAAQPNPADPNAANAAGQPAAGDAVEAGAASASPAAPGVEVPVKKDSTLVTVLNNSSQQGMAEDVTGRLEGNAWKQTSFGNLPGTAARFDQSVVLYPAGNAQARAAAEEVGRELGIPARERTPANDASLAQGAVIKEGQRLGDVVVVLVDRP